MAITSSVFPQIAEQWLVDKMDESVQTTPNRVAVGTGSTAANKTDTTLGTEVESRATATLSQVGTSGDTLRIVGLVAITAARALREVGVLDAGSSGNLIARFVHDVINLDNGDSIEWTIDLAPT